MQQERWVIYQQTDELGNADEVAWSYTIEKSIEKAERLAAKTGATYRIDFELVNVTRDGIENLVSDPDRWSNRPSPTRRLG